MNIEQVVERIIGAIIVIFGIIAIGPLLITGSTAPICNQGIYNGGNQMCQFNVAVNQSCPSGWTQAGLTCMKAPKYNDATTQLIVLIIVIVVFIAAVVYIFREKKYS